MLVDTSGARFDWRCGKGGCELGLLAETPAPLECPPGQKSGYSYMWNRFIEVVSVCSADGSWTATLGAGRYLACQVDGDCPQFDFYASPAAYECSAGLCQNVDLHQHPRDVIRRYQTLNLCFAEIPRGQPGITNVHALLDQHCGPDPRDPCPLPLPEPCWQP